MRQDQKSSKDGSSVKKTFLTNQTLDFQDYHILPSRHPSKETPRRLLMRIFSNVKVSPDKEHEAINHDLLKRYAHGIINLEYKHPKTKKSLIFTLDDIFKTLKRIFKKQIAHENSLSNNQMKACLFFLKQITLAIININYDFEVVKEKVKHIEELSLPEQIKNQIKARIPVIKANSKKNIITSKEPRYNLKKSIFLLQRSKNLDYKIYNKLIEATTQDIDLLNKQLFLNLNWTSGTKSDESHTTFNLINLQLTVLVCMDCLKGNKTGRKLIYDFYFSILNSLMNKYYDLQGSASIYNALDNDAIKRLSHAQKNKDTLDNIKRKIFNLQKNAIQDIILDSRTIKPNELMRVNRFKIDEAAALESEILSKKIEKLGRLYEKIAYVKQKILSSHRDTEAHYKTNLLSKIDELKLQNDKQCHSELEKLLNLSKKIEPEKNPKITKKRKRISKSKKKGSTQKNTDNSQKNTLPQANSLNNLPSYLKSRNSFHEPTKNSTPSSNEKKKRRKSFSLRLSSSHLSSGPNIWSKKTTSSIPSTSETVSTETPHSDSRNNTGSASRNSPTKTT